MRKRVVDIDVHPYLSPGIAQLGLASGHVAFELSSGEAGPNDQITHHPATFLVVLVVMGLGETEASCASSLRWRMRRRMRFKRFMRFLCHFGRMPPGRLTEYLNATQENQTESNRERERELE
eukprot:gene3887-2758_t